MRFKLDENLPIQIQLLLTEHGHDAVTVLDEGIGGATDSTIASVCQGEQRVLVTLDKDFADIRAYPPDEYPGIVVLRLTSNSTADLLRIGARIGRGTFSTSSPQWPTLDSGRVTVSGSEVDPRRLIE